MPSNIDEILNVYGAGGELDQDRVDRMASGMYRTDFTRVEVIDEQGRSYVKYLSDSQTVTLSVQDGGRTLKVFIDDHT